MRLIVLAGLVSVEKTELAARLAGHYTQAGLSVTLLDNGSRLPAQIHGALRVGDLRAELLPLLQAVTSEVVILAASETLLPDDLFVLLSDMKQQLSGLTVQTIALIDTRTCDCFPQFRLSLEAEADVVIHLPALWSDVVKEVA